MVKSFWICIVRILSTHVQSWILKNRNIILTEMAFSISKNVLLKMNKVASHSFFYAPSSYHNASSACAENHNKYENTDLTPSLWNTIHVSRLSINLSVHPLSILSALGQHRILLCMCVYKNKIMCMVRVVLKG